MATKDKQQQFEFTSEGPVYVSRGVSFRTVGTNRVITVHGVVYESYDVGDRITEFYAMAKLWKSGYATQVELARAFGYSARSVRRYVEREQTGGIPALARGAGRAAGARVGKHPDRDELILHFKGQGLSNRAVGGKLGISEAAIRKRLRQLHWPPPPDPQRSLPIDGSTQPLLSGADDRVRKSAARDAGVRPRTANRQGEQAGQLPPSMDTDPLDRANDRAMAALGMLDDAAPMFARADRLPMAGVLLAVPSLIASGIFPIAQRLYSSIGPAFYPTFRASQIAFFGNFSAPIRELTS
jgi:hypothetical protein